MCFFVTVLTTREITCVIVEFHQAFCQSNLMFCNPLRQKHQISAPKNTERSQSDNSPHCFARMWWIHVSVTVCEWLTACQQECAYSLYVCVCHSWSFLFLWDSNYSDKRPLYSAGVLDSALFLEKLFIIGRRCITMPTLIKAKRGPEIIMFFSVRGSCVENKQFCHVSNIITSNL